MFGHTQIVRISLVVETLLFVSVLFKIFIVIQMLFIVMLFNAMLNTMLMLFKKRKNTNLDDNLFCSIHSRDQVLGADDNLYLHIHEADIRYRWSTSREKCRHYSKGCQCFSKDLATHFLWQRDAI